jgi:hypothetical protein
MIILVIAVAIIFSSLYWGYMAMQGKTGPQVHEDNKILREENERLRNEVARLRQKR